LTATRFTIVSLLTGETDRTITIPKVSAVNARSSFLTTFDHNFALNDAFLVCGGVGGDLDVWYWADPQGVPEKPLYTLPSPFVTPSLDSTTSNLDAELNASSAPATAIPAYNYHHHAPLSRPPVPRFYSNLTLSTCGRYVAATTSNELWTFDLVSKKILSCVRNERIISVNDYHAKNPPDDFPCGIWVSWVEYKRNPRFQEITKISRQNDAKWQDQPVEKPWIEAQRRTAYITNIRGDDDSVQAYLERRSNWVRRLQYRFVPRDMYWLCEAHQGSVVWILALMILLLAIAVPAMIRFSGKAG
jgi:hypothetical protein